MDATPDPCMPPELRPDYDRFDVLGTIVARHRILRVIGSGGMGTVYEGEHVQLGERRALKFCRIWGEPSLIERRALNEAKIGAMLRHPGICLVHDFDAGPNDTPVIVMELLCGHSLGTVLRSGVRLAWPDLLYVLSSVCDALALAHTCGVVHRDIKPENIFLTPAGPKVVDFGISMLATARATRTGTHLGTPSYMAPEQMDNARTVDGRADLYSCGVVLYQGISGRLPFRALNPLEVMEAVRSGEQPEPIRELDPSLPAAVASIVERCMAKDPAQRYQSALELKDALEAALDADGMRAAAMERVRALAEAPRVKTAAPSIPTAPTVRAKVFPQGDRVVQGRPAEPGGVLPRALIIILGLVLAALGAVGALLHFAR
jgi:serine/threonine-protein kinase